MVKTVDEAALELGKDYNLPNGLVDLTRDMTKEIIYHKPSNVELHLAEYLESRLENERLSLLGKYPFDPDAFGIQHGEGCVNILGESMGPDGTWVNNLLEEFQKSQQEQRDRGEGLRSESRSGPAGQLLNGSRAGLNSILDDFDNAGVSGGFKGANGPGASTEGTGQNGPGVGGSQGQSQYREGAGISQDQGQDGVGIGGLQGQDRAQGQRQDQGGTGFGGLQGQEETGIGGLQGQVRTGIDETQSQGQDQGRTKVGESHGQGQDGGIGGLQDQDRAQGQRQDQGGTGFGGLQGQEETGIGGLQGQVRTGIDETQSQGQDQGRTKVGESHGQGQDGAGVRESQRQGQDETGVGGSRGQGQGQGQDGLALKPNGDLLGKEGPNEQNGLENDRGGLTSMSADKMRSEFVSGAGSLISSDQGLNKAGSHGPGLDRMSQDGKNMEKGGFKSGSTTDQLPKTGAAELIATGANEMNRAGQPGSGGPSPNQIAIMEEWPVTVQPYFGRRGRENEGSSNINYLTIFGVSTFIGLVGGYLIARSFGWFQPSVYTIAVGIENYTQAAQPLQALAKCPIQKINPSHY